MADFTYNDLGSLKEWELSFHDYGPQTFSLTLMLTDLEEVNQPQPGNHSIGHHPTDPTVFLGIFTNIEDGNYESMVEYDTFTSLGTLTIVSSTDEKVVGSFEFSANTRDEQFSVIGSINISGSFEAYKRIPL